MFSATISTAPRRILARALVVGGIAIAPLTALPISVSAEPPPLVAVGTAIGHDHIAQDRPGPRGNDQWGDRDRGRGNDRWGDRGRGNDPLWRLFRDLIPGGSFGSG
ncbi:hypothetical protein [Nocardia paucivorans]|uniref:hypothetical protein n=1 Tax=Nocardia paucivorans TaxID=114259 RepID=UPI0002E0FF57|nr:hypothetical protein [Nocardia paucivorans]